MPERTLIRGYFIFSSTFIWIFIILEWFFSFINILFQKAYNNHVSKGVQRSRNYRRIHQQIHWKYALRIQNWWKTCIFDVLSLYSTIITGLAYGKARRFSTDLQILPWTPLFCFPSMMFQNICYSFRSMLPISLIESYTSLAARKTSVLSITTRIDCRMASWTVVGFVFVNRKKRSQKKSQRRFHVSSLLSQFHKSD